MCLQRELLDVTPLNQIKVLSYKDKGDWTLETKYNIAKKNENYRKSSVSTIENGPDVAWLFHAVGDIAHKLNSKYYRFNLSVLDTIEYVVYKGEEDGRYDWHHDYNEGLSKPSRKLTMVIQLSDPSEYEGGQLELFEDIQIPKQKGLVQCSLHLGCQYRVTPVLSGTRKVLVAWIWGPPFS